jgi:RNA polymerase-binding protein DksA
MPAVARRTDPARQSATGRRGAPAAKAGGGSAAQKAPAAKKTAVATTKAPTKKAPPPPAKKAPTKRATKAPAKQAAKKVAPAESAVRPARANSAAKAPTDRKAAAKPKTTAGPKTTAVKAPAVKASAAKKTPDGKATSIAVPTGTEWTATELRDVRGELVTELQAMQTEYDQSIHDLNELQSSSTDGAGDDQADAGSKTFEREQELSIAANRLDLLAQIQRAVERIDAGTYGFCESCGKPIPKARLKAFPMATLDVACKQREERR